jgi:cytochrome c oxidase subunit II
VTIFGAGRRSFLAAGLWLVALAGAAAAGAAAPPRPAEFDVCQGCHGVNAQGNAELGAPRIAGLDAQYIGRQLADFRDERRGTADSFGRQMITIAAMLDDAAIARLSSYISALPEVELRRVLSGDPGSGQSAFATCAACHGAGGEGNARLAAPRLRGMSDWYLQRQFAAFAAGNRGTAVGDERGAAMRSIAASMSDEQSVRDVIAYAASLQPPSKACGGQREASCDSSR